MAVKITDEILMSVQKPARYTGNEWNMIVKDPSNVDIRYAFCFPDVYEVGMSHLGMKILYHVLNKREDTYCERVFAPWPDMEEQMRKQDIPLFSLETKDIVKEFNFIGFTLQYEMSYTNILNMLDLANVPLFSKEREYNDPFVCAGGPCSCNPEPVAEFIDFFVIGEGEEVINEVLDEYKKWKKQKKSREDFLLMISKIEGIYVPLCYEAVYNTDGSLKSIFPKKEGVPSRVKKRIIKNMDAAYFPTDIIVPYISTVHDRVALELFRGCIRGCRFCQAGYIYRPVRERSYENLLKLARESVKNTGYEEISLVSLSTSDYTHLPEFTKKLIKETEKNHINLSLPSLRIDNFSMDLMKKVQKVRKSGITFAPEAGTQRLRNVINKGVTEEDLIRSVKLIFKNGWNSVKLYFMLGLPTETLEDIEGIANLSSKVLKVYRQLSKEKRAKGLKVTVSVSCFVPKPFTPFQWEAQDTLEELTKKQSFLSDKIREKARAVKYNWHEAKMSIIEAVLARGDRRIAKVLYTVWKNGGKFDSWSDYFDFDRWINAFKDCNLDFSFYAHRKRNFDEVLPWDHIDLGISKKHLITEAKKAYKEEITPDCRMKCSGCGAGKFGVKCF